MGNDHNGFSMLRWAVLYLLVCLTGAPAEAASDRLADAVQGQDKAAIRRLLGEHADVNVKQGDGSTALAWAAHWDDVATADLLIRAGANPNLANDYGVTPLSLACTNRSGA